MSIVAFFPWLQISQSYDFGAIKIIPYTVETANAISLPDSIDDILSAYKTSSGHKIQNATLLEYEGKIINDHFTDNECEEIFLFQEMLSFVGLASRAFFGWGEDYINSSAFKCIIQKFDDHKKGVSFNTRRRDGIANTYLSEGNVFFQCPHYIHSQRNLSFDTTLVKSLLSAAKSNNKYREMIGLFNLANTDNEHFHERIEITLCVIALETLFNCDNQRDLILNFRSKNFVFPQIKAIADCSRQITQEMIGIPRYNEKCQSLLEVWLKDLYRTRNKSAHGGPSKDSAYLWTEKEHLLLFAYIFPCFIKFNLEEEGFYSLTKEDKEKLLAIDYLLCAPDFFKKVATGVNNLTGTSLENESSPSGKNWEDWPWNIAFDKVNALLLKQCIVDSIKEVNAIDFAAV